MAMTAEERRKRKNAAQKKYYKAHRNQCLAKSKEWRDSHKEEIRQYAKNHPIEYERYKEVHAKNRRDANAKSKDECDMDKYHTMWTLEEVEFLCENYYKMTIPQLSKVMKRTIPSIERKRNRLGLVKKEQK